MKVARMRRIARVITIKFLLFLCFSSTAFPGVLLGVVNIVLSVLVFAMFLP